MDALQARLDNDLQKLHALAGRSRGILQIGQVKGSPVSSIVLRIRIPTARNENYPGVRQEISEAVIQIPPKYPLQKPRVSFTTPIWNPNVYTSGQLCYGDWKITEFLDLFVIRLMKVLAYDPTIINPKSPARRQLGTRNL